MSNTPVVPIYPANVDSNGLFVTSPKYASDGGDSLAKIADVTQAYIIAKASNRKLWDDFVSAVEERDKALAKAELYAKILRGES